MVAWETYREEANTVVGVALDGSEALGAHQCFEQVIGVLVILGFLILATLLGLAILLVLGTLLTSLLGGAGLGGSSLITTHLLSD